MTTHIQDKTSLKLKCGTQQEWNTSYWTSDHLERIQYLMTEGAQGRLVGGFADKAPADLADFFDTTCLSCLKDWLTTGRESPVTQAQPVG